MLHDFRFECKPWEDNILNIKGTYREGSLSDLQVIHSRKADHFYHLLDALFPGCGQQHYVSASIHHCSATILQQHKDLPSRSSGVLNLLWDVLHLSKIIRTIKKRCFNLKRLKTKRTGEQSKETGYTHTKQHPGSNSPMTGAKKHWGGKMSILPEAAWVKSILQLVATEMKL